MENQTFVMMNSGEFNHLVTKVDALVYEVKQLSEKRNQEEKFLSSDDEKEKLLSPKQLAKKLNKSIATIYSWREQGIIQGYKLAGSTYFDLSEVLRVIKS